ncbi:N-acetylmuramoyl-L-alanine amidase [Rhodothalassium salexigens]|uniref:N-acetylmuramoyl-L-alanine amidase n=1 Tax=Rhodothalassium salexigens TaxID=1086 RepID=UPI0019134481|nr:N-acetylmuramoyl-L-alanine amidase [Rhodothalassium salexigens]
MCRPLRAMTVPALMLAAFAVALFGAADPALGAEPRVVGLRVGENADRTRFVIDLDRKLDAEVFTLADPYRLVVNLPEVTFDITGPGQADGRGLIREYRYGLFKPGTSRVVLDLAGPATLDKFFTLPPSGRYGYRLVFDLTETSRQAFIDHVAERRAQNGAGPRRDPVRVPAMGADDGGKPVVVIDPGHGGTDPGTIGVLGRPEKTVVLGLAKTIRDRLQKSGRYEVHLTRDRDIFHSLRNRIRIAHEHQADLFISVHADALDNRNVRGATVYTLSETASDREAAALARKENKADLIGGIDLNTEAPEVAPILIDLAQRRSMNQSARLASFLVGELKQRHVVRTNTHRFAGFVVLKSPEVPSILLESGYLSNPRDARLLESRNGRARLAEAVARAVDSYFDSASATDF